MANQRWRKKHNLYIQSAAAPPTASCTSKCARMSSPPAASRLPQPLRLRGSPRPAATPLCAGLRRACRTSQSEHCSHIRLPASSSSRLRLPPPAAPDPLRESRVPRRPPQEASLTTYTASARRSTPGRRCPLPALPPYRATPLALRRRPTACSTSSGVTVAMVTSGVGDSSCA